MTSPIQVRGLLALRGRMEATQVNHTLHTLQPMIDAMLNQLEKMGKAVRIQEDAGGYLSGSCKGCPEGKTYLCKWWVLYQSDALRRVALRSFGLQMVQTSRSDSAFVLISGFFVQWIPHRFHYFNRKDPSSSQPHVVTNPWVITGNLGSRVSSSFFLGITPRFH